MKWLQSKGGGGKEINASFLSQFLIPKQVAMSNGSLFPWPLSAWVRAFTSNLGTNSDIFTPTKIKAPSCSTSSEKSGPTCQCAVQLAFSFIQHKQNPSWQRFVLPVLVTRNTSQPRLCLLMECLSSCHSCFGNFGAIWGCEKAGLSLATSVLQNLKIFEFVAWVNGVRESYISPVCFFFFLLLKCNPSWSGDLWQQEEDAS